MAKSAAAFVTMLAIAGIGFPDETQKQSLSNRSAEQLLRQARDAYTIFGRTELSRALAAKGGAAIPQLSVALQHEHWHVRHCALLALVVLAKDESYRLDVSALAPALGKLVTSDPHHGVRIEAAICLGTLAEQGRVAQQSLAKAAVNDSEAWARAAAAKSLAIVKADLAVMLPVYEAMIRSSDKESRASGISEASRLLDKKIEISSLIPALKDVFRNPIYDANYSSQTRVPAINLLVRLKVDTSDLVPSIVKDLSTTGQVQADGYHPYQRMTLKILGRMGAHAEAAIPVLQEVIADPAKFGCDRRHPDYKGFIADSRESIDKIRSEIKSRGSK